MFREIRFFGLIYGSCKENMLVCNEGVCSWNLKNYAENYVTNVITYSRCHVISHLYVTTFYATSINCKVENRMATVPNCEDRV